MVKVSGLADLALRCCFVAVGALLVTLFSAVVVFAESASYEISEIEIQGNRRIDTAAIKLNLKAVPGRVDAALINEDIKTLYKTGYFDQVNAALVNKNGKYCLRYSFVEKPVARKV
ncbi:MAG: hypothetical protein GX589_10750, partial [Deltaproteobacteria bacterium]|nr:hypothetical protein [Deltaproteobacteria bacterium]